MILLCLYQRISFVITNMYVTLCSYTSRMLVAHHVVPLKFSSLNGTFRSNKPEAFRLHEGSVSFSASLLPLMIPTSQAGSINKPEHISRGEDSSQDSPQELVGQSLLLLLSSPTTMLLYCFCCCSLNDAFTLALFSPPSLRGQTEIVSRCCTSASVLE